MDPARDLEISRRIDASPEAIWRAWSEPELIVQWWCPRPWRTELIGFEPRSGGVFHTRLSGDAGECQEVPGMFLEWVAQRRIVFTTALCEGWRPAVSPVFNLTAVITLEREAGATRYHVVAMHPDAAECTRHRDAGFHEGWGICLDQLEALARAL